MRQPFLPGFSRSCATAAFPGSPLAQGAAISRGADARSRCGNSRFDSLEWAVGVAKRRGLVDMEFQALQQHTPKPGARFYAEVIAAPGATL